MFKVSLNHSDTLKVSNYPTEKKSTVDKSRKRAQYDGKENRIVHDGNVNNHFSLRFEKNDRLIEGEMRSISKKKLFLCQKRKRVNDLSSLLFNEKKNVSPNQQPLLHLHKELNESNYDQSENGDYLSYTDNEYHEDLTHTLNEPKHLFMYKHFPSSYDKLPFFYNIKGPKRSCQGNTNLNINTANQMIKNDTSELFLGNIPKKKWSPTSNLYDNFLTKLETKWDYSAANFCIELILEFIMKNNINWELCLDNVKDCVSYVKYNQYNSNKSHRLSEKNYKLREHKTTKYSHGVFNNVNFEYYQ